MLQRQIEVLHDSRQDAFICGKNAAYGGDNSSGAGGSGNSSTDTNTDQPISLLNFAITELVSWNYFVWFFFLLYH